MTRRSNFELLRILAMAMIIGLHYLQGSRGGALTATALAGTNYYIAHWLESAFLVGVALFVLITGYFQYDRIFFRLSKVAEILLVVAFYGVGIFGVAVAVRGVPFSIGEFGLAGLPYLAGRRWFVETYVILYMLSPFINASLRALDQRGFQALLAIMLLFFSVWPSFLPGGPVSDNGYGIITFVLYYCIGAYLRRFELARRLPTSLLLFGYLTCATLTSALSIAIPGQESRIWGYNFLLTIGGAVLLFLVFARLNITSKTVNLVAGSAFGVYVIHSDYSLARLLYRDTLHTGDFWSSPFFVVHVFGSIAAVYVACTILDLGRRWMFGALGRRIVPSLRLRLPALFMAIPRQDAL